MCVLGLCLNDGAETVSLVLQTEAALSEGQWQKIHAKITDVNAKLPDYMRFRRIYLAQQPIYTTNTLKTQRLRMKTNIESGEFPLTELKLSHASTIRYEVPAAIRRGIEEEFASALMIDVQQIAPDADFMLDLHGDSLSYAELVTRLEERFAVQIPPESYGAYLTTESFGQLLIKLGVRP